MREQKRLVERGLAAGDPRIRGDAGHVAKPGKDVFAKGQRHEGRAGFRHCQTKLAGDLVAKAGCPHLGDGFSAAGHDKLPASDSGGSIATKGDRKAIIQPFEAFQLGSEAQFAGCARHLGHQHGDDILGGIIAEELSERLLVIGDAVLFDQRDEVVLRITAER